MAKPNVIFFMVDQLNHKCLGYKGHPVVKTPNLDKLRADAVDFSQVYSQNGICMPSRVSFLSGQYLFHHRQYGFTGLLSEDTPSLPGLFKDNGYRTAHVGKGHVNCYGENLGFDVFVPTIPEDLYRATDPEKHLKAYAERHGLAFPTDQVHGTSQPMPPLTCRDESASPLMRHVGPSDVPENASIERFVSEEAIKFLNEDHNKPYFLHVSFDRPHGPHSPSPEYAGLYKPADIPLDRPFTEAELEALPEHVRNHYRWLQNMFDQAGPMTLREALSQYYALITHIDHEIGRVIEVLKEQGEYNDAVILFSSDHGDYAGYRGMFEKFGNRSLHDDIARIPLLIKFPGQALGGAEVSALCESIDVFPTLVDLCGLDGAPDNLDGKALAPLVENEPADPGTGFSENYTMKMLRKGDLKLIYYASSGEGELYDLADDPGEYRNLYCDPAYAGTVSELKVALLGKLTGPVSNRRKEYIRSLFDDARAHAIGGMEQLYKWDMGIIDGGGFWMVFRDGYRLTCIPFDGQVSLDRFDKSKTDGLKWEGVAPVDDVNRCNAMLDEALDYVVTKVRPISTFNAGQQDRDMMFQTRGFGFC